ncbi:hypothetical protein [Methanococcus voltae]|uniref:Uncharacterized protein n=1 Tax=Methanococcus voltae (strain ATCC BAA-1334 / A3) TaxID=456320 RepID=D7DRC6_METV3|nr:hypothetical protein [Methanococcus voltae]MCS3901063.1 hypothetical protein [Methanococcus voltae]
MVRGPLLEKSLKTKKKQKNRKNSTYTSIFILIICFSLLPPFLISFCGCIDNSSNKISSYIYEINISDDNQNLKNNEYSEYNNHNNHNNHNEYKKYLLNLTFYDNEKVNIYLKDLNDNKSNQIQIPYKFENKSNKYIISYLLKDTGEGIDINVQIDKNTGTLNLKSDYLLKKGIFSNETKFNVLKVE